MFDNCVVAVDIRLWSEPNNFMKKNGWMLTNVDGITVGPWFFILARWFFQLRNVRRDDSKNGVVP